VRCTKNLSRAEIYIAGTAIPKNKMGIDDASLLQEIILTGLKKMEEKS
jgi:hypothetical protein